MSPSSQPSDIELLFTTFPAWSFGAVWTTAASGPDRRRLLAIKGGVILAAWNADDLAAQVVAEDIAAALRDGDDAP